MTAPINDFLRNYAKKYIRCHTPGHKGRSEYKGYPYDITEVKNAGSLYDYKQDSIITQSETTASSLFGSAYTLYSTGGSTLCIQAMLFFLKRLGIKRIAASRFSHRSFISTAGILDFDIDWLYPVNCGNDCAFSAEVSAKDVYTAISAGAEAVFVTAIDYYGGECDIESIAEVCNRKNIPLLADNAHGAYKVFTKNHPVAQGAWLACDSAHKTLPALTGAAYLHVSEQARFPVADIRKSLKQALAMFGTSSPSYLILRSLDLCNVHIAKENTASFSAVQRLKEKLSAMGYTLKPSDAMRVTIRTRDAGYSGFDFAEKLRANYLEPEYAGENHAVLLFSTVTTAKDTQIIADILKKIKLNLAIEPHIYRRTAGVKVVSPHSALFGGNMPNCICTEVNAPCPPGVAENFLGELTKSEQC
jgi:arginine/lysine/ornithine decarboxylase